MAKTIGIDWAHQRACCAELRADGHTERKADDDPFGGRFAKDVHASSRRPSASRSPTQRTPSSRSSASWAQVRRVNEEMTIVPYEVSRVLTRMFA